MEFHDCCVYQAPDNATILGMASILGWDGICMLRKPDQKKGIKIKRGPGLADGMLLDIRKASSVKKLISSPTNKNNIVAVRGSCEEVSRAVLESREADLLVPDPMTKIDLVMAKLAKENSVAVCFEFRHLLENSGGERSRIFSQMKKNAAHLKKCGSPFCLCSGAMNPYDMRSPSDLMSFGRLLGFGDPDVKKAVSGRFMEKAVRRKGKGSVMPGVEVEE